MCVECLVGYTDGVVLSDPTPEQHIAAGLINWVYGQDWGGVGGPLHIITDDHNLEDTFFKVESLFGPLGPWSVTYLDWDELTEHDRSNCERLYGLLRAMTEAQRAQTMALAMDKPGAYR